MFTKINQSMFIDAFRNMGRETQFSYAALVALFQHMVDTEDNCGEEVELDVIALCCEFAEYEDIEEYNADYTKAETMEDIEDRTTVIYIGRGDAFLIQQY